MDEKRMWTGIAPSPQVFQALDQEETAVLALLAWSACTNRPVRASDLAALPGRDGKPHGLVEAGQIVDRLTSLRIISVRGMRTPRPLSIFLGGFQPRARFDGRAPAHSADTRTPTPAQRTPQAGQRPFMPGSRPTFQPPAPRPAPGARPTAPRQRSTEQPPKEYHGIRRDIRIESSLAATRFTPDYVFTEVHALRAEQSAVESGDFPGDLVAAAEKRLDIVKRRIALYERWLRDEPRHPKLAEFLERKRRAIPELEFQIERARVKQAELNAGKAA